MGKEFRIPTVLGIFALLVGVVAGVFLIGSKQLLFLKANVSEQPSYVTLTNISDTGFTVSWTTQKQVVGLVQFGTDASSLNNTAMDDRDTESQTAIGYITHHVTVGRLQPLSPATEYFFVIQSGGTVYDDSGKPYSVRTATLVRGQSTEADSVSGQVFNRDGSPAEGGIVYVAMPNVSPLSTVVTSSGNWVIPLIRARATDLSGLAVYDRQATIAQIFVQGATGDTATASVVLSRARPTPTITLGQTYDWKTPDTAGAGGGGANNLSSPTPTASASAQGGFLLNPLAPAVESNRAVVIVSPGSGESVNTSRPSILGTGPKNTKISITVESAQKMTGITTIADDGSWQWNVPGDLTPGQHTITVTYTDALGQLQRVAKSFVVSAADTGLPAFVATQSGIITSPKPSVSPTATPSSSPAATLAPRVSIPATGSGLPNSGDLAPTFILAVSGSVLLLIGALPLFLNKLHDD